MRSTRSSVSTWIDSNGPRGMFCSRTSSDCSGPSERTRRRSEPARPFHPAAAVAKKKASRSEAFRRPEPSPSAFRGEVGTATPTRSPSPAPLPRSAIGRNYPRGAPSSDMTLRYCLDCHGHHQSGYSCPQREARRYQASAARKARGPTRLESGENSGATARRAALPGLRWHTGLAGSPRHADQRRRRTLCARQSRNALLELSPAATRGDRGSTGREAALPRLSNPRRRHSRRTGGEVLRGKWCCRCRQWLSPEAFRPNANYSCGLDSWCRSCHADATRQWRANNQDYVESYNERRRAEYRAAHPLSERPCVVCGEPFSGRRNALVCGERCRRQRKLEQRRV